MWATQSEARAAIEAALAAEKAAQLAVAEAAALASYVTIVEGFPPTLANMLAIIKETAAQVREKEVALQLS
jgi:hypothetical protein